MSFTLTVNRPIHSEMVAGGIYGPIVEYSGFHWNLHLICNRVFMCCKKEDPDQWRSWSVAVKTQLKPNVHVLQISDNLFDKNECKKHVATIKYIRSVNKIECVVEVGKIREQLRTDFSIANEEKLTNAVIVISDKEFHVCKEFLASHSTYFKQKFFDKNADHFIIDTPFSASQFQEFLWLLYHEVDITERNLSGLLETSCFFKCKDIKAICMDHLISSDKLSILKKIELAEKLELPDLLETLRSQRSSGASSPVSLHSADFELFQ